MMTDVSNLLDQKTLEAAFEQFNAVSGQLIEPYNQLEAQVNVLNAQLDEANNQLRKQRDENAALAERLQRLLEVMPAGVVELSAQGEVRTENPAAIAMLGGSCRGKAWQEVTDSLEACEPEGTYLLNLPEGTRRLSLQSQALPAAGGHMVLIHDVTRLHQLTRELGQQQKLAAMGSMAASLAHQLRTPLATAMLYTANLRQEGLKPEDRLRFIDKSLARMKALEGLIQNMLGFVRGQVSSREVLGVTAMVEDICAVMAPQCHEKGLVFDCSVQLPAAISVMGDRKAVQGALINLLENAIHFSPPGGHVWFGVSMVADHLLFRVEDEGSGLPSDVVDQLFEPFFTTRSGGTGLGLAIVKKVADELGGSVRCHNRETKGSCFELTLPCQENQRL